jgi:hypothetical protein
MANAFKGPRSLAAYQALAGTRLPTIQPPPVDAPSAAAERPGNSFTGAMLRGLERYQAMKQPERAPPRVDRAE